MSDENQIDIEDTLQDELVTDTVEVSNEDNLEEAATADPKADGVKAADRQTKQLMRLLLSKLQCQRLRLGW